MPQRKSAIKELRKNRKNRLRNLDIKTGLKKTIKTFESTVKNGSKDEAGENLKTVYQKLDKAAKRNVLHKKTAARRKSKFARQLAEVK